VTTLLRFKDLQARRIVANWPTLRRWIESQNFPPGRLIGPNSRAWSEMEVDSWLEGRPTAKPDREEAASSQNASQEA
jgi:predicted DNA-binding transcriptional regulator AlpA